MPYLGALLLIAPKYLLPVALIVVLRFSAERAWPMAAPRRGVGYVNIMAYAVWTAVMALLPAVLGALGLYAVNRLGGGLLVLPSHGLGLAVGFLVYFLAADLGEYLFHRAEHAVPALWAMHSLHHADSEFDAGTSVLHYWGAPVVHLCLVSAPMGLLFKVPPIDLALFALLSNHVFIMHANVKWDFGRLAWLVTSPAYHRLHHSMLPEHMDRNFASILPVWDHLFGTYAPAKAADCPPVGIGPGQHPRGLFDLVFWPVRTTLRRRLRLQPARA